MIVGVMKDYKLKQRNLRASHTLGWWTDIGHFWWTDIGLTKNGKNGGRQHLLCVSRLPAGVASRVYLGGAIESLYR